MGLARHPFADDHHLLSEATYPASGKAVACSSFARGYYIRDQASTVFRYQSSSAEASFVAFSI